MDQPTQALTPGQEILSRTRSIDENTARFLPLPNLLELPTDGLGPLDKLREALVERRGNFADHRRFARIETGWLRFRRTNYPNQSAPARASGREVRGKGFLPFRFYRFPMPECLLTS